MVEIQYRWNTIRWTVILLSFAFYLSAYLHVSMTSRKFWCAHIHTHAILKQLIQCWACVQHGTTSKHPQITLHHCLIRLVHLQFGLRLHTFVWFQNENSHFCVSLHILVKKSILFGLYIYFTFSEYHGFSTARIRRPIFSLNRETHQQLRLMKYLQSIFELLLSFCDRFLRLNEKQEWFEKCLFSSIKATIFVFFKCLDYSEMLITKRFIIRKAFNLRVEFISEIWRLEVLFPHPDFLAIS